MAGRRSLSPIEERLLLSVVRELPPRDRCLITVQWFTGFRISEILSLTVGSVLRGGEIVSKIGIAPRNMKGGYGRTRWIPVLPELHRSLVSYVGWLRQRYELTPAMPLFLSRECDESGNLRPLTRESARRIMHAAFAAAGVENDGRLGTHTLRKTWARKVYQNSGNDIMILKAALNHSDVSVTQKYLEADEDDVMAAIQKCDFTRKPKAGPAVQKQLSFGAPEAA
jgi:integrase